MVVTEGLSQEQIDPEQKLRLAYTPGLDEVWPSIALEAEEARKALRRRA